MDAWVGAVNDSVSSYRRMIDAAVGQLSDEELWRRPSPEMNSVAVILRHLGGNLQSRWTDFLTTDGEKSSRNRDKEFADWDGDRESLIAHFDTGWNCLTLALQQITDANIANPIAIRGEPHSIPQALIRSITHLSYHVGQIVMIAHLVHEGEWQWLTIAPSESEQHNQSTWGNSSSRGLFGQSEDGENL